MRKLYFFPQKNLLISLPLILIFALVFGMYVDTSMLKSTTLIATMIMIYPTMVGIQWKSLLNLSEKKLFSFAFMVNFILIPLIAFFLGKTFLINEPIMFAGLVLIALLPTSGMTISWTSISGGNVPAAVKLTVFGLITGAILAPFYLLVIVGQVVDIKLISIMRTILVVVFIPLILGGLTTVWLKRRFSQPVIRKKIKPSLQPISIWAMLYIIFSSVSMRSEIIANNLSMIGISIVVLIIFYLLLFMFVTLLAKRFFQREDALSFVYGTSLRNLSIAMGVSATTFGIEATLLITIAFIVQQQGVVLYKRLLVPKIFKKA